uniref:Serpentine receptor class gamma n=1 Tax=Caenorhabditis japonica TaxID=281687 RepID=A0A8R1I860_CAEJA
MNSSDTIPFQCNTTYNGILGILGYMVTICYMIPAILLHLLIVRCVLVTHKQHFRGSSFFLIFVTDSVAIGSDNVAQQCTTPRVDFPGQNLK